MKELGKIKYDNGATVYVRTSLTTFPWLYLSLCVLSLCLNSSMLSSGWLRMIGIPLKIVHNQVQRQNKTLMAKGLLAILLCVLWSVF